MRDIPGYEGLYAVTSCGKVWSYRSNKFLKPGSSRRYPTVVLSVAGQKKTITIHRLVALAYIPNPNNLPEVNHKDENKEHNYVNNLEWCDKQYNNSYGTRNKRISEAHKKPIYCVELDRVFESISEAANELGCVVSNIASCLKGRYDTACGYHWEYIK